MSNPELTHESSPFDRRARAVIRAVSSPTPQRRSATRQLARGLGWFSIGLGLAELLATRTLARAVGLQGREAMLRACGVREIVSGLGILASRRPAASAPWVWSRVAGDAIDLAALGTAALQPRPRRSHPVAAAAAVAGVTALDLACASTLASEAHAARQRTDYSDRAGLAPRDAQRTDESQGAVPPRELRAAPGTAEAALH